MRFALPQSGRAPLVVLAGALVAASAVVEHVAPAGLLPSPERPFAGYGNPSVRIEHRSYPRHATGADDVRTTIEAPPRRIVSQSWSTDEYLYSVVAPERVVGVSESAYREAFSNVYALAQRYRPIVALDPEQPSPQKVVMQVSGIALRIRSDTLRAEFKRSRTLQDVLLRYTLGLFAQISQSVVCHRFHTVPERLARWLLVVRDRAHSNSR